MTELEEWFNKYFWPSYPSELAHGKKGPKTLALKAFERHNPDEDKRKEIMTKLEVLVRSARSEKGFGKEPDRWPFASTWINQERWNCIEDLQTTAEKFQGKTCSCGKPVHIVNQCWDCYGFPDRFREKKKAALDELGLTVPKQGSSRDEIRKWQQDCREWGRINAKRVLGNLKTA